MKASFVVISLVTIATSYSCSSIQTTYEHFKTKEVVVVNPYDQYRFDSSITPIADGVADENYLKEFKKLTCKKLNEEDCSEKYRDMFKARLKLKYKEADVDTIKQYCIGYPIECNNNKHLEQVYTLSNNYKVDSIESQEKARVKAQADADTREALMGFASAIAQQQDRVNQQNFIREQVNSMKRSSCTTNVYGNTINTNCN